MIWIKTAITLYKLYFWSIKLFSSWNEHLHCVLDFYNLIHNVIRHIIGCFEHPYLQGIYFERAGICKWLIIDSGKSWSAQNGNSTCLFKLEMPLAECTTGLFWVRKIFDGPGWYDQSDMLINGTEVSRLLKLFGASLAVAFRSTRWSKLRTSKTLISIRLSSLTPFWHQHRLQAWLECLSTVLESHSDSQSIPSFLCYFSLVYSDIKTHYFSTMSHLHWPS